MRRIMRVVPLLAIPLAAGCANPSGPSETAPQFLFPGRGQAEAALLTTQAVAMFARVSECADAVGVRPEGVRVRLFLPGSPWHCPVGTGGCIYDHASSIDALDWRAGVGYSESFGHEAIHLARWLKTGDIDNGHAGPWWVNGRACQAGLEDLLGQ